MKNIVKYQRPNHFHKCVYNFLLTIVIFLPFFQDLNIYWHLPLLYEIRNFILKKYNQLNFSPAVENVVIEKQKNYKKRQRDVRKQVQLQGVGTKSQQALKLQHDQSKSEHILQNKKQKELDKMRLFALKQQKKKEKHKGH